MNIVKLVHVCVCVCVSVCVYAQLLSHVQLFLTPWSVAHQAHLSMGFPGKNTGVGCHVLLQGIFPTDRVTGLPIIIHLKFKFQSNPPYSFNC